ncbi:hypothetical protein [Caenispirillum bisanense]|uniref:hypothetical protein n=1 Tax=Caenispirillum bisanense TaxID=414052 RepID=UPI0031DD8537
MLHHPRAARRHLALAAAVAVTAAALLPAAAAAQQAAEGSIGTKVIKSMPPAVETKAWTVREFGDAKVGSVFEDADSGKLFTVVSQTGAGVTFVISQGDEQEIFELPLIWSGTQKSGETFRTGDSYGILLNDGRLQMYVRAMKAK